MRPSFIIFARYPEEGQVKTRLAPLLGVQGSTRLYRAMMLDIIERIAGRGAHTTVCVTPGCVEAFREMVPPDIDIAITPQRGDTLGDRMHNAFLDAQSGVRLPTIVIGTDSPTLPDAFLDSAEQALASGERAVLGPACDGGFYLIGLAEVHSSLFFGGDYSNSTVFGRTQHALAQQFGSAHILPEWYDIDDAEGLQRLRSEPDVQAIAPRTAAVLESVQTNEAAEGTATE